MTTYADAAKLVQETIAARWGVDPSGVEVEDGFEDDEDFLVPYREAGVDPRLVMTQDEAALVSKADGSFHEELYMTNLDRFDAMREVQL